MWEKIDRVVTTAYYIIIVHKEIILLAELNKINSEFNGFIYIYIYIKQWNLLIS